MSQQLLALAGFGFLLGMRHATDADHVIAVTTILARSRRFVHSTVIGALWGFGHTVTVLLVGVAIIVFNVVIPPPVGLAMELAVAVMLVLATIHDTGTAVAYLVVFCVGVSAGMAILTTVIGLPFLVSRARSERINRWLTIGSGALSLAFGIYLGYQIGFVDGLFTGHFHWTPA